HDAGEAKEVVGDVHEALALFLQALDALLGAAFALTLRLLKVFVEQLQIEAEGAEVVFDLVDEPAGQLRQFGVLLVHFDSLRKNFTTENAESAEKFKVNTFLNSSALSAFSAVKSN